MKATPDKSKTAEARTGNTAEHSRSSTSPTKQQSPPPSEKDDDASANPNASDMEGGRKGSVDGKFEADHRPSR